MSKKNVLFIHFKRYGDLLMLSSVLESYRHAHQDCSLHLLVFEEFAHAAEIIKRVDKVHLFNRQHFNFLKKNHLINKSYLLNDLHSYLESFKEYHFQEIINLSFDQLSMSIISYLSPPSFKGISFDEEFNPKFSNQWAFLFNEIGTQDYASGLHLVDWHHLILEVPYHRLDTSQMIPVKTNPSYNQLAFEQMSSIRKTESSRGKNSYLIGLYLSGSKKEKTLPVSTIARLIQLIIENNLGIPLLLIAPLEKEKKLANEIIALTKEHLITIEMDFISAPSILFNLDLLVTPDTAIKHLAVLTETSMIEISQGMPLLCKHGGRVKGSLIVSKMASMERNKSIESITALDLFQIILLKQKKITLKELKLSRQTTLYQAEEDSLGVFYHYLTGNRNSDYELSQNLSRSLLKAIYFHQFSNSSLHRVLDNFERSEISHWLDFEKECLTLTIKVLLKTLELNRASQGPVVNTATEEQLVMINRLASWPMLLGIPLKVFSAKWANCKEKSSSALEKHLLELKNNIQIYTQLITQISNQEAPSQRTPSKQVHL